MLKSAKDFARQPEKYYLELDNNINKQNIIYDRALLKKAYYFSINRHNKQFRESGEPFASHPYAVANILIDLKLDYQSVITALLHDTVEDGVATDIEIKKNFGFEIHQLVEGVTKLSKIQLPNKEVREASNFSKFILAICKDIRVLIIKLADRLHNMRTIKYVKDDYRRYKIAQETLEVYAPLAERVGFQIMREELEDLAFKETNSEAYQSINKRIQFLRKNNENFIKETISNIEKKVGYSKYKITGREKKIYSTWKKMSKKAISLEKISDINAFRIITDTKEDCYHVLGIVHTNWPMIPDRFKDFISTPKPNGYESIHTTVIQNNGMQMELQIRSKDMHQIAEYGVASHWIYKSGGDNKKLNEINQGSKWFQDVLEIIKTAGGPRELMEYSRMDMYSDNVFCFTPKGDVISLLKRATALDFAYTVHTNLGNSTIGVKVNGNLSPLNTLVKNGDQIEVIRSKGSFPQQSWLNFCVTGKARSQIRKFLRDHEEDEFEKLGKEILKKFLLDINKKATKKTLTTLISGFNYHNYRSFYVAIGRAEIASEQILEMLKPKDLTKDLTKELIKNKSNSLPIIGLTKGAAVNLAECCNPLNGENIVGILVEGKGMVVHLLNCSTLERFSDFPELWHELMWNKKARGQDQVAQINITLQNKIGSLNKVTYIIKKAYANIVDIKLNKRSQDFFEMEFYVMVKNSKHLQDLMDSLKLEERIYKIIRA